MPPNGTVYHTQHKILHDLDGNKKFLKELFRRDIENFRHKNAKSMSCQDECSVEFSLCSIWRHNKDASI